MSYEANKEKARVGILALSEAFPEIFNRNRPKPLALGIAQQLAQARRSGALNISVLVQRAAMNAWVNSIPYHRSMALTPCRYNLDGSSFGLISDDHRQRSIDKIKAYKKIKAARRQANKNQKFKVAA